MVDAGTKKVLGSDPNPASHERARAKGIEIADMQTLLREADVVVATTGVPGLIKAEMVREGQVIMALTNPYPEIEPEDALAAGAAFAADGKSVNNVLGYPGIFRGALLSGAKQINPEMKLAAANVIAELASGAELVPNALEPTVHERVAGAVRDAAIMSGVARLERAPTGL
jgi:malate dehydrogenase (oxaloacetate-decarboxylating)